VPGQGSGSGWNYTTTLAGTDLTTASAVTSSQTFAGSAGPFNPPMSVSGAFGNAPAFTLFIDESAPLTSRTIGTRDFTITAAPLTAVPEPASLTLLGFAGAALLARRRK
jgi:hypothetical protein